MKKLIRWTSNIVVAFLILLSVSSIYSIYQTKKNPNQLPSILGYKVMTVLTGSMEPQLKPGDLIAVKTTSPENLNINDVITYRNSEKTLVTHRIIDLIDQDGVTLFQTKGDANNIADEDLVTVEQLIGTMQFHIPKIGLITNFIKSPLGLVTTATIFLILIFISKTGNRASSAVPQGRQN